MLKNSITIDGKNELTLPKVIVRDFLKQILEHVDLVLVRRGEKVVVSVPVHTVGEHDVMRPYQIQYEWFRRSLLLP